MKKQLLALIALGALISGTQLFAKCQKKEVFEKIAPKFGCNVENPNSTCAECQRVCCIVKNIPVSTGAEGCLLSENEADPCLRVASSCVQVDCPGDNAPGQQNK